MKSACALALFAIVTTGAMAQHKAPKPTPKSGDRAMFEAMFKEGEKMIEKRDLAGFYKGTTSDFTETFMGKTVKKAESLKGFKQFIGMFSTVHCKFDLKTVKVSGNTATTMGRAHIWGASQPNPKTHKTSKVDASRDEAVTWVKRDGHWLVKSIVATKETFLMDGKPMAIAPSKK